MRVAKAVYYLCRSPGLHTAGRTAYRLYARGLARMLAPFREVRGIYLLGSMAGRQVEPGLSDVDVLLVVRDLAAGDEARLLRRIERLLRFTMPPLGKPKVGHHVVVLSVSEWRLFGDLYGGKQQGATLPLLERGGPQPLRHAASTKALHHFSAARVRLFRHLLPRLSAAPAAGYAQRQLERTMQQCIRSAAAAVREMGAATGDLIRDGESALSLAPPQAFARLNRCFHAAVAQAYPKRPGGRTTPADADAAPEDGLRCREELRAVITEQEGIAVCRHHGIDYLVYDAARETLTAALLAHYGRAASHGLRTYTPLSFERLEQQAAGDDFLFVDLASGRSHRAPRRPTREHLVLEALALFLQRHTLLAHPDAAGEERLRARCAWLRGQGHVPAGARLPDEAAWPQLAHDVEAWCHGADPRGGLLACS